jgi:hypothetical protein
MRNIVFEITDNEQKTLAHYCRDPQDWIENAVNHLIELAKDEMVQAEKQRILDDPDISTMTTSRDELIRQYAGPLKGNPNG